MSDDTVEWFISIAMAIVLMVLIFFLIVLIWHYLWSFIFVMGVIILTFILKDSFYG